jgi:hypothetical protein
MARNTSILLGGHYDEFISKERVQMKTNIESNDELRNKIKKGLDLTFKKLLKSKRQTDGYLVFSENGKIKKIKATDISE